MLVTKALCRRFIDAYLPNDVQHFELAWTATLGSLGLKNIAKASPAALEAIRDRLSATQDGAGLYVSLAQNLDYVLYVIAACAVELREFNSPTGLSFKTISAVVDRVISDCNVPEDVEMILRHDLPRFIGGIGGGDLARAIESNHGVEVPREAAESQSASIDATAARSGRRKYLRSTQSAGFLPGPYTVRSPKDKNAEIITGGTDPTRVRVRSRNGQKFLTSLAMHYGTGEPLSYEDTCGIFLTDKRFKELKKWVQEKLREWTGLMREDRPLSASDVQAKYDKLWGERAHKPVSDFRKQLVALGIDPRDVFRNVRDSGYELVSKPEGPAQVKKWRGPDPDKTAPTSMLSEQDSRKATPSVNTKD